MFQYAIARSIAHTNQTDFKMDVSGFETYALREYELGHFSIMEYFANTEEIQRYKEKKSCCTAFLEKLFHNSQDYRYYKEKTFNYDPGVFKLKGNVYLDGYWQTEKYFEDIEEIIKNDFTVKTEPDEKNRELLNQIKNCNAVAVHIRRGDYVMDPQTESILGSCSLDYYRRCVEIIAKRISDPHFFVFSDDPKWTKENIEIDFPTTYIYHNGPNKGYEDLRLMSHCKHFIIANSSFSWWGAWLSDNSDKIVVAPKSWFRKEDNNTKDLIPEGWLRIQI
jgi:hypothetical protein